MQDKTACYAVPFALWELRLYLDTHPCDTRTLETYRQMAKEKGETYASVPASGIAGDRWHWTDGPWPWEFSFEGGI